METAVEPLERLLLAGRVRDSLDGLMEVESYAWDERGTLTIRGHLTGPAQSLYRTIRKRIEALGFTPFLRRGEGQDELLALPGVIEHRKPHILLPVILFIATILSVILTGAINERSDCPRDMSGIVASITETVRDPVALAAGLPFAITLLTILFTHEMGHYIVGRLRHAPVSLPYFIPIPPFISFTGTMGAVIVQREPMEDRRTVLEVGIAGPLAGLLVAIPLLFYGLATSQVGPLTSPPSGCALLLEGNSILYSLAKWLVFGQFLPRNGIDVLLSPVALGAWIGLLVTMLNLLPVGQLDGGHVAYALLGRRARYLAYAMILLCLVLGLFVPNNSSWLIWAVLIVLIGPNHPAPLNDIPQLDGWHKALAIFGLIVFLLLLMPRPLTIVS